MTTAFQVSPCNPTPILAPLNASDLWVRDPTGTGCWGRRYFDRAIIVLVDALRHDFIEPLRDQGKSNSKPHYRGNFPAVASALATQAAQSRLAIFEADPPTTTSQRLKALTTGGLPTFLEIRKNFDSQKVGEDNWVDQIYTNGGSVGRLGDNTWDKSLSRNVRPIAGTRVIQHAGPSHCRQ